MAESDQPKKETVRIQLPHPPVAQPSEAGVKQHKTVRIQLPVRETGNPVPSPPQSAPGNISAAIGSDCEAEAGKYGECACGNLDSVTSKCLSLLKNR